MDVHASPDALPELKEFWGASRCAAGARRVQMPWSAWGQNFRMRCALNNYQPH
jgi:hypothetical protein